MAAYSLEDSIGGQGRYRKKQPPKTSLPSHYQFAHWGYEDGHKFAVPVGGVRKTQRPEYPLLSTAMKNESSGTETLMWLTFDLDFIRADKKWRQDGKLHWPKIAETLQQKTPELFKYLTGVTRSSGGKGLGLALCISPLELIPETGDIQKMGYRLQAWIISILNFYGMGADPGARGLKRLMPNLFQPDRLIDRDEVTEAMVQTRRPRVMQILLNQLRDHPALRAPRKSEQSDLLWTDIRVELPCARLYTDLLDEVGPWGSAQWTAQALISRYGISKNTVYKLLANPPQWLGVEAIAGEGFRLTLRPTTALSNRAYGLLETGGKGKAKGSFESFRCAMILPPEEVADGERNEWLVSVVLACKWKGIARSDLLLALRQLTVLVPGYQSSRSLTRELQTIVRSLYHHRSGLIGCAPELLLPDWLAASLIPHKSNRLSQTFSKKGTFGSHGIARSSAEQEVSVLCSNLFVVTAIPGPEALCAGVRGELAPGLVRAPESLAAVVTESLPTGSVLRNVFSKALLKSQLSAEDKGRLLGEVCSLPIAAREDFMRSWMIGDKVDGRSVNVDESLI